jgi:DNA-binding transcriptional MerR regulator
MASYLTSGQVARSLRVSVSTLKRWLADPELELFERRNANGWRLFADKELDMLKEHKRKLKKNGKRFAETTLLPIVAHEAGETRAQA